MVVAAVAAVAVEAGAVRAAGSEAGAGAAGSEAGAADEVDSAEEVLVVAVEEEVAALAGAGAGEAAARSAARLAEAVCRNITHHHLTATFCIWCDARASSPRIRCIGLFPSCLLFPSVLLAGAGQAGECFLRVAGTGGLTPPCFLLLLQYSILFMQE